MVVNSDMLREFWQGCCFSHLDKKNTSFFFTERLDMFLVIELRKSTNYRVNVVGFRSRIYVLLSTKSVTVSNSRGVRLFTV